MITDAMYKAGRKAWKESGLAWQESHPNIGLRAYLEMSEGDQAEYDKVREEYWKYRLDAVYRAMRGQSA